MIEISNSQFSTVNSQFIYLSVIRGAGPTQKPVLIYYLLFVYY